MEDPPVLIVHSKPLAISRPNVDVDGAEVVVLLVSWCPGSRDLHVQLHRVHAQDGVSNVGQEICLGAQELQQVNNGHLWMNG